MGYYSRRHYQMVSPRASTPQEVVERVRYRKASERALVEMKTQFPVLSPESFAAAMSFVQARTQELINDPNFLT